MKIIRKLLVLLLMSASMNAYPEEYTVDQVQMQFRPQTLTIKVGDMVHFVNADDIIHSVYSFSESAPFDLGSYKKGETRDMKFGKAGVVKVKCYIHQQMSMTILVEKDSSVQSSSGSDQRK
jgi:plastocyanin